MRKVYLVVLILFPMLIGCEENEVEELILMQDEFSSDLFFSEYIEGTSYNKALEIKNLTGETIILDQDLYSIKKQSNGTGSWIGELFLTGILAPNDVFVIANAASDISEIVARANQVKSGAPMDFNGNDPIGLFKNGVLIDVIGEPGNPENFGKDLILKRKPEVTEPSATFFPEQWEILELNNTFTLGDF